MKLKKVIFKIGFSKKIGTGHLSRSLRVTEYLKQKGIAVYLSVDKKFDKKKINELKKSNPFQKILNFKKFEEEKNFFLKNKIDNLFIDDPKFKFKLQLKFAKFVKNIILYQDIPEKNYCNILINHNLINSALNKYKKISNNNTKFFLGPEYFNFNRSEFKPYKPSKDITIFFGGLSNHVLIQNVLRDIMESYKKDFKINCFLGIYNKQITTLKKKYKTINFYKSDNQQFFINKLSKSYFFIGAGGTTLFESLSLAIPSIIFCTAKNQLNNCNNLNNLNKILYIKKYENNFKLAYQKLISNKKFYNLYKKRLINYSSKISSKKLNDKLFKNLY